MKRVMAMFAVMASLVCGVVGGARASSYYDIQQYIDQVCDNMGGCDQSYENVSNVYQSN